MTGSAWPGLCGHEQAARQLRYAVELGRIRHSYLFIGPEGVGKTALSTAFAQALLCQEPVEQGVPCGSCRACRKIARGVHPDVETWSLESLANQRSGKPATNLGIDVVRSLAGSISVRPMEADWRISIIDDAESMFGVAQEALLKTLEDPPSFSIIILLSDDGEQLLPTIRSRCETVALRPVDSTVIAAWLKASGTPAEVAEAAAALSGGLPGWAQRATIDTSLLDQRRSQVERAIEWIAAQPFERIVRAFRMSEELSRDRRGVIDDLDMVATVWRDALVTKSGRPALARFRDHTERILDVMQYWHLEDMFRALRSVQECIADIEANVRPRLALESMVVQWPEPYQSRVAR